MANIDNFRKDLANTLHQHHNIVVQRKGLLSEISHTVCKRCANDITREEPKTIMSLNMVIMYLRTYLF